MSAMKLVLITLIALGLAIAAFVLLNPSDLDELVSETVEKGTRRITTPDDDPGRGRPAPDNPQGDPRTCRAMRGDRSAL